jgi:crossover junction endodeoxyribonuclease RusA
MKQPDRISSVLPWPNAALSPNRRQHWSKRATVASGYRAQCRVLGLAAAPTWRPSSAWLGASLHAVLVFTPPDRRHYDLDNLIARMKPGLDGLCEGLGINDVLIRAITATILPEPAPSGSVAVTLRPWNPNA